MASADLKDELTCAICLNLYADPITLPCGHNFCRECIENVLDTRKESRPYSCPECRAEFQERPVLQRNTTLRNIAGRFLSQEECQVFCTYCVHTPVVASKTCLWCEASLCDIHLTVHSKSQEHILIQPTKSFRIRKCSRHKKVIMYYCTEDAECLCATCYLDEKHRGHQVELLNEASKKKKDQIRIIQDQIIKEKEEIVKRVQRLQDHLRNIPDKAAGIVERVGVQFRDIRMELDNLEKRVLNEINKQQEQVSLSVSDLIQQLDLKKDSLSRNISAIEELCNMTDPLLYLQADRGDFADVLDDSTRNLRKIDAEDLAEDLIMKTLKSGVTNIMSRFPRSKGDAPSGGREKVGNIMSGIQKGYFVHEASGILLDMNTASNNIHISEDLKTASLSKMHLGRPETPERFEYNRVLSMKGFSKGRLYWDVEVSKEGSWRVGMTYPSIGRKGQYSLIGNNNKSWCLRRVRNEYSIRHDGKEISLSSQPSCCKVRIYLDYTAGLLTFYELGNSMRHLYTYHATFTEALYPVIAVWDNAWMRVLS